MKVTVKYLAQIKRTAGVAAECVELESSCTLKQLLGHLAEAHGDPLRGLLFRGDRQGPPSLLFLVGDQQVRWDDPAPLLDGAEVTILSPMAGG